MIRNYIHILLALFFALPMVSSNIYAQEEPIPDDEVLRFAAENYAGAYEVSIEEALERLNRQPVIGDLQYQLSTMLPDVFAGLWIEHTPTYRIVIKTLPQGEEEIRSYIATTSIFDLRSD